MEQRHWNDVLVRAKQKLGSRAATLGPLDLSRNALRQGVVRVAKAYSVPPFVGNLVEGLSAAMADRSAKVTIDKYAQAEGRPMPAPMVGVQSATLRYRLGCAYSGTLIGWSSRSSSIYLEAITPDRLQVDYLSDDPSEPTVIRHRRPRLLGNKVVQTVDIYDLTDLDAPVFRVLDGKRDVTSQIMREEEPEAAANGWPAAWRFAPEDGETLGRPFHRIVIGGDPRQPYSSAEAIETTLNACTYWTHWGAGITDAGHPSRHVRGLRLVGMDSSADPQQSGIDTGPEIIHAWEDVDQEKPGQFHQFGPGFDPEVIGRAVRSYENDGLSFLGLRVDMQSTGGEPTEQERRALEEAIAETYAECRRVDSEVLRRAAAIVNRITLTDFSEDPYPVLYRAEIAEALEAVEPKAPLDDSAADLRGTSPDSSEDANP